MDKTVSQKKVDKTGSPIPVRDPRTARVGPKFLDFFLVLDQSLLVRGSLIPVIYCYGSFSMSINSTDSEG